MILLVEGSSENQWESKLMTKYTTFSEELSQLPREQQEAIKARVSEIYFQEITGETMEIIVRFPNKETLVIGD